MVEIGIKSTVWRQVSGFPNVNELDLDRVDEYARDGATYALGTVDIYTERHQFFPPTNPPRRRYRLGRTHRH